MYAQNNHQTTTWLGLGGKYLVVDGLDKSANVDLPDGLVRWLTHDSVDEPLRAVDGPLRA